ncbi:hypothetical protein O181_040120 [Austropuccinia psidii MF-1]|uniref:Uncharacterized protein n=1 Tax=Austropuccinia psidii MF-1 TaxID=1389203 RepID=A0A9Q3DG45_9BASI|nr:hypothetical protein [Austropuccinia psidii MF-1]
MNLEDDIKSEIRLITEKMKKRNEANINIPKVSTPFSHIRSPVEQKEEIPNPFITDLSHQGSNQVSMKEWPTFTGEGEYDHLELIKTIEIFQEDYAIKNESISTRLHLLFEKSAKICYYGIRQINGKNTWYWWKDDVTGALVEGKSVLALRNQGTHLEDSKE